MTGDWMDVLDGDGHRPDEDFLPVELKDDGRLVLPAPEPGKADAPLVLPGDEEGALPGLLQEAEPFSPNGPSPLALDEHGRPIDDGWMF